MRRKNRAMEGLLQQRTIVGNRAARRGNVMVDIRESEHGIMHNKGKSVSELLEDEVCVRVNSKKRKCVRANSKKRKCASECQEEEVCSRAARGGSV